MNEAAYNVFYTQTSPGLIRFVKQFLKNLAGNEQDAEDIVQEAFFRAWRYGHEDNQRVLFTIAKNLARDLIKHRKIVDRLVLPVELESAQDLDEKTLERYRLLMTKAVQTLTPQQQAVIVLRWKHNMILKEIGERLNMSKSTVNTHLCRAIKKLQENTQIVT